MKKLLGLFCALVACAIVLVGCPQPTTTTSDTTASSTDTDTTESLTESETESTEATPLDVSTAAALLEALTTSTNAARDINITADIDCASVTWSAGTIANYSGYFDGNGHTISNIVLADLPDQSGVLFKSISGGTITNVVFEDCSATTSITAGKNSGFITGCFQIDGGTVNLVRLLNVDINASSNNSGNGFYGLVAGYAKSGTTTISEVYTDADCSVSTFKCSAILMGGIQGATTDARAVVNIDDCFIAGRLVLTNGDNSTNQNAGMVVGYVKGFSDLTATNLVIDANISTGKNAAAFGYFEGTDYTATINKVIITGTLVSRGGTNIAITAIRKANGNLLTVTNTYGFKVSITGTVTAYTADVASMSGYGASDAGDEINQALLNVATFGPIWTLADVSGNSHLFLNGLDCILAELTLDEAKVIEDGIVDLKLASVLETDYAVDAWTAITTAHATAVQAIIDATTIADARLAKTTFVNLVDATVTLDATAYINAVAALNYAPETTIFASDYQDLLDACSTAYGILTDAEKELDEVEVAKATNDLAIEQYGVYLNNTNAAEYVALVTALNYSSATTEFAADYQDDLDACSTKYATLNPVVLAMQSVIDAKLIYDDAVIQYDAYLLANLPAFKTAAIEDVNTAYATYVEADYSTVNWAALVGFKDQAPTDINAATNPSEVNAAKAVAIDGMDGVLTLVEEADLAAANAVEGDIDAIPDFVDPEDLAAANTAILAARTAYDALTVTQQGLVENYAELTAAETKYASYTGIGTAAALLALSATADASGYYYLTTNIDMALETVINPLAVLSGTFDGCGYTISNLSYTTSTTKMGALFITVSGTVKDITFLNCTVSSSGKEGIGFISTYGSNANYDGIVFSNVDITGTGSSGYAGLLFYRASNSTITVNNVQAINCQVTSTKYTGLFVGDGNDKAFDYTNIKIDTCSVISSSTESAGAIVGRTRGTSIVDVDGLEIIALTCTASKNVGGLFDVAPATYTISNVVIVSYNITSPATSVGVICASDSALTLTSVFVITDGAEHILTGNTLPGTLPANAIQAPAAQVVVTWTDGVMEIAYNPI